MNCVAFRCVLQRSEMFFLPVTQIITSHGGVVCHSVCMCVEGRGGPLLLLVDPRYVRSDGCGGGSFLSAPLSAALRSTSGSLNTAS